MEQCKHCNKFFENYRCSQQTHGECDCPKCQGFCECEPVTSTTDEENTSEQ